MSQANHRSRWHRSLVCVIVLVAVGYCSNAVTAPACGSATSRWLDDQLALHATDWPDCRASSLPAGYALPWIAGVDYEWVTSDTGGAWGRRYYFCLFGVAVPVRVTVTEQA